jgi:hypothetical protein
VLAHIDPASVDLKQPLVHRTDRDFPVAWAKSYGAGRVFYSTLGHEPELWDTPFVQQMYFNAIRWAVRLVDGDATAVPAASVTGARTHVRWVPILALIAVGTMINYLDRTVLGIAAPFLSKDLGLTASQMGLVFSAFSWSYALLQIPGGIFLDPIRNPADLLRCRRILVGVHRFDGGGAVAAGADCHSDRRRRVRGAMFSSE